MNLNELSSLSDREIIDSIARTVETSIEKALLAELSRRQTETLKSLNVNIFTLNSNIEKLLKTLNENPPE